MFETHFHSFWHWAIKFFDIIQIIITSSDTLKKFCQPPVCFSNTVYLLGECWLLHLSLATVDLVQHWVKGGKVTTTTLLLANHHQSSLQTTQIVFENITIIPSIISVTFSFITYSALGFLRNFSIFIADLNNHLQFLSLSSISVTTDLIHIQQCYELILLQFVDLFL